MNSEYVFRMETLLLLYALAYEAAYPVVCFDKRPCFLIGDMVEGLAPEPGRVAKEHYSYTKHGSCVVMGAVEPLTGKRLMNVYKQRTKKEYTAFMQALAAAYPTAVKIRLVQDNLNTHTPNAMPFTSVCQPKKRPSWRLALRGTTPPSVGLGRI